MSCNQYTLNKEEQCLWKLKHLPSRLVQGTHWLCVKKAAKGCKQLKFWSLEQQLDYEYKSMNISLLNSTEDAPKTLIFNENTAVYNCVPMCQCEYASAGSPL
jgi:hypothetical protein